MRIAKIATAATATENSVLAPRSTIFSPSP